MLSSTHTHHPTHCHPLPTYCFETRRYEDRLAERKDSEEKREIKKKLDEGADEVVKIATQQVPP